MNPYEAPRENPPAGPTMEACAEVLVALGATPQEAKPWFYRMLWRLGLEARPPPYATMLQRFFVHGLPFAALWTLLMNLTAWRNQNVPVVALGATFLAMTLVSMLTNHWSVRRARNRRNLPDWEAVQALAAERMNIS